MVETIFFRIFCIFRLLSIIYVFYLSYFLYIVIYATRTLHLVNKINFIVLNYGQTAFFAPTYLFKDAPKRYFITITRKICLLTVI